MQNIIHILQLRKVNAMAHPKHQTRTRERRPIIVQVQHLDAQHSHRLFGRLSAVGRRHGQPINAALLMVQYDSGPYQSGHWINGEHAETVRVASLQYRIHYRRVLTEIMVNRTDAHDFGARRLLLADAHHIFLWVDYVGRIVVDIVHVDADGHASRSKGRSLVASLDDQIVESTLLAVQRFAGG